MSALANTWINEAYDSAKRDKNINLKSLATIGAIDLLAYDPKGQIEKKRDLLELLINKSQSEFQRAESYLDLMKEEYSNIYGRDNVVSLRCELECRGSFGAGSSFGRTAFEIGLAFDTILNLPFLPGSSIKGAVRAAYKEDKSDDERIFGSPNNRSEVIFGDAYPISSNGFYKYFLYPDIINPHYQDDEMDETKVQPTPVIHLTVPPGLTFRFIIAFRKKEQIRETLEAFAVACHRGLGARTAIGYGKFHLADVR